MWQLCDEEIIQTGLPSPRAGDLCSGLTDADICVLLYAELQGRDRPPKH